jgi:hypothetical protein
MGFSGNGDAGTETLFVAGGLGGEPESSLASIDTTTFSLDVVGTFNPPTRTPELTGTGAGDLFAFYAVGSGSAIGQIDKTNAEVTGQSMLPGSPREVITRSLFGAAISTCSRRRLAGRS